MKTWQMIKELTENPNKRFTASNKVGAYVTKNPNGGISWYGKEQKGQPLGIWLYQEWKEVKKPVIFMEAVKAANEGKLIGLNYRETQTFSDCTMRYIFENLTKYYDNKEFTEIILTGKWYIED